MHQDERGHAMTTGSAEAAAALDGAVHNFLHWKAAVMPGLKGALSAVSRGTSPNMPGKPLQLAFGPSANG